MTKILLIIDKDKILKSYDDEYCESLRKKYNDYLGYDGVTKVESVICSRKTINRKGNKCEPSLLSSSFATFL